MSVSEPRPDVLIVGAGVVGAACAYYLSREGMKVELVDSGFAGSGTTAAGMGHLAVMDDSDAEFELCRIACNEWAELSRDMPDFCEVTDEGCLWIAADEEEMALLEPKVGRYTAAGIDVEILDSAQLAEIEPELRPGLPGAFYLKRDQVLYQLGATRWLLQEAIARGASLREHTPVRSIGAGFVETATGRIDAGMVVNAAGAWAQELTPELRIEPRKGHLVITDRYPNFCRRQVMELGYLKSAHELTPESVAFNVQPRATGQLMIGSSRELVGWDRSINQQVLRKMLRRAFEFMPGLEGLSCIRTWTGFRPATPDKLPYIGRWPRVDDLWIAAGHEGLGIMTATGTALLLTDLILGRESILDPAPFDPTRVLSWEEPSA